MNKKLLMKIGSSCQTQSYYKHIRKKASKSDFNSTVDLKHPDKHSNIFELQALLFNWRVFGWNN